MADRFEMRQARRGMLAGLQPSIDGMLGITGGGQMMGQEFGLTLDEIGEMLLENGCHSGVQFLSPDTQQRAVGSVLHQRVLEQVEGLRRNPPTEQQPSLGETVKPSPQSSSGPPRHMFDQVVAELAAEHRADLPNLFG